jgi:LacI family transcriptional regulator
MATIYDIAKKTGFSPPTISKALNGAGSLSVKTREIILKAAGELGYMPNLTARTLSTRRSHLIGILNKDFYQLGVFISPIFNNILGGFSQVMENNGYDILILSRYLELDRELHPEKWNYRNIDGILIFSVSLKGDYNGLLNYSRPCVSTNDIIPGVSTVITDNYAGAIRAVQHLVDLGHRKIAYIAGPVTKISTSARERRLGYRDCLKKNGIAHNPDLEEKTGLWSAQGGYEAAKRLLLRTGDFTAVFASSDNLAFGTIRALRETGLEVPGDISIVGFDGDLLGQYITPALTTMRQDAVLIGRTAAEIMLKKLEKPGTVPGKPDIIRIPAELVIRDSCRRLYHANQ